MRVKKKSRSSRLISAALNACCKSRSRDPGNGVRILHITLRAASKQKRHQNSMILGMFLQKIHPLHIGIAGCICFVSCPTTFSGRKFLTTTFGNSTGLDLYASRCQNFGNIITCIFASPINQYKTFSSTILISQGRYVDWRRNICRTACCMDVGVSIDR